MFESDPEADAEEAIDSIMRSDALFALELATVMVRGNLGFGGGQGSPTFLIGATFCFCNYRFYVPKSNGMLEQKSQSSRRALGHLRQALCRHTEVS